jgi:hypothetical protein
MQMTRFLHTHVAPFQLMETSTLDWSAGWMSPGPGLEAMVKKKNILVLKQSNFNSPAFQPTA